MQQMWVAARSGAHHYAWDDGAWRDTRDGSELFAALSRIAVGAGRRAGRAGAEVRALEDLVANRFALRLLLQRQAFVQAHARHSLSGLVFNEVVLAAS